MSKNISKFMSLVLRHQPELLGLTLEPGGWVLISDLLEGLNRNNSLSESDIRQIVKDCQKQRFAIDETGTKIRANQGHSTEVDLQLKEVTPPDELYHGTVERFLDSILKDGLKKMDRHDVHLSRDLLTATQVGSRRGKPVILSINSAKMALDGYKFRLSENNVWLTDHVPPQYINLM